MSDRPTHIYWLFDTRPTSIAEFGWPCGVPFYCGKTEHTVEDRLKAHRYEAARGKSPRRKTLRKLIECGQHVRVDRIETVAPQENWRSRERHWISVLRTVNVECTNVNDGGERDMTDIIRLRLQRAFKKRSRLIVVDSHGVATLVPDLPGSDMPTVREYADS